MPLDSTARDAGVPEEILDDQTTRVMLIELAPSAPIPTVSVDRVIDLLRRNWARFDTEEQSRIAVAVCELWEGRTP